MLSANLLDSWTESRELASRFLSRTGQMVDLADVQFYFESLACLLDSYADAFGRSDGFEGEAYAYRRSAEHVRRRLVDLAREA